MGEVVHDSLENKKSVLISGCNGMIGSHALRYFQQETDWRIVPTTTDLTEALPDMGRFDVILHLASLSSVAESIDRPTPFIKNNVAVTLSMLEYARQYPPDMFINFSTTGIYSSQTDPNALLDDIGNEWGSILPTSPYIASKLAQEAIAYSYYHTFGVPVVIVSSSNVVGPNQQPNNFIPKILQAISAGDSVPIYTNKGEIGSRVYNTVTNILDALRFMVNGVTPNMDKGRPDTFSVSGGERLNNLEMAQLIADLLGKPLEYNLIEASSVRPGYDAHYDYSNDGLERLGWRPPETLRDGLRKIVESLK